MDPTEITARKTFRGKDDRAYEAEQKRKRRKPDPLPEIPDGDCCARCKEWEPPGRDDDFGCCRIVVFDPLARPDARHMMLREEAKALFVVGVEPMPTRGNFVCSRYRGTETMKKTLIILGSRVFVPLKLVDREIRRRKDDIGEVVAVGVAPVAERAMVAAEKFGVSSRQRHNLAPDRAELVQLATAPNTTVLVFVARDPATKEPTEGTGHLIALLRSHGVEPELIETYVPPLLCQALADLHEGVLTVKSNVHESRRKAMATRALKRLQDIEAASAQLTQVLERTAQDGVGNDEQDAAWIRKLKVYEAIQDGLQEAMAVLGPYRKAAAA